MKVKEPKETENSGLKWRYLTRVMHRETDLDQIAAEGWELISVIPAAGDQAVFYFKRRQ